MNLRYGPVVWLNGRLVSQSEALVPVSDRGLLSGHGVFETLRIYGGVPFAFTRHVKRLSVAANAIDVDLPDSQELFSAVSEVIEANSVVDGRLRITVTAGPEEGDGSPTILITTVRLKSRPRFADIAVTPWQRNEKGALTGIKSVSYGENLVALAWASQAGAEEAIFANTSGNLCEGATSNIFVVVDGKLCTPPLSAGCLPGVTRELIIPLMGCEEIDIPMEKFYSSVEEAFLTSSTREVQPIRSVNGKLVPDFPGPITKIAANAYRQLVDEQDDP